MMKKQYLVLILLFITSKTFSQFYYTDILGIKLSNNNYYLHKANKVKSITVKNSAQQSEDENTFSIKETFSKNWQEKTTEMNLPNGKERTYTTAYYNDKIARKDDDGINVNSLIRYEYDASSKLTAIKTSTIDTSVQDGFFEKHLFTYDNNGLPIQMLKIKNTTDTTIVKFIKDESNNIGEERWYRKGTLIETFYYYYNERNLLTDIVKYNDRVQKMLPEFLFEYNDKNQLTQTTQIPFGSNKYTVIKYSYNEAGLKTEDRIYSKYNDLLNKVEYVYEF